MKLAYGSLVTSLLVAIACMATPAMAQSPATGSTGLPAASQSLEPTHPAGTLTVDELARDLKGPNRPVVMHVGFESLYRLAHVPGAAHYGELDTPRGKKIFIQALHKVPAGHTVVLYCGCCPWEDCPNVQPAALIAKKNARGPVQLLYIPRNFDKDWVQKGLPTQGLKQ